MADHSGRWALTLHLATGLSLTFSEGTDKQDIQDRYDQLVDRIANDASYWITITTETENISVKASEIKIIQMHYVAPDTTEQRGQLR